MRKEAVTGKYGFGKTIDVSCEEAVKRTKLALKEQGFGILSEIDVQRTMKENLGVDHPKYLILGACNPNLAHQALQLEPDLGLLLPCNVLIQEREGKINVSMMDAGQMLSVTGNAKLAPLAQQANEKLKKALEAI